MSCNCANSSRSNPITSYGINRNIRNATITTGPHTRTYSKYPSTKPTNRHIYHTDWHYRNPTVTRLDYITNGSYAGRNRHCGC